MSTINFSKQVPPDGHARYMVVEWPNMANGDVGEPIALPQMADRSVQVVGTFGGGSVTIEGSINGTDYATLTDPQGNDLVISTGKIEAVTELVRFIRPRVTGDGTTSLNVSLLMRLS